MKKLGLLLIATLIVAGVSFCVSYFTGFSSKLIDDNHIYFFEQSTCPHCHHAKAYIQKTYPNVAIQYMDVQKPENQKSFFACADKFYLDQTKLGTPLICMGQNVVLGWGEDQQKQFDEYVKIFMQNVQLAQ